MQELGAGTASAGDRLLVVAADAFPLTPAQEAALQRVLAPALGG